MIPASRLQESFRDRGIVLDPVPGEATVVPRSFGDPVAEHLATRREAGLFDFSFIACFELSGAGAAGMLECLQTRSLARLAPGRIAYTLLLDPDGTARIDATLWRLGEDRWWLFTGRRSDAAWVGAADRGGVRVEDRSSEHAVLALQGPASSRVLERHLGPDALAGLAYFGFTQARIGGIDAVIGRLGYTAERGYENVARVEGGEAPWTLLTEEREMREW